jgi:hypothetical protein
MRAAVAVPVGPGDRELDRLRDLMDSLRAHTPDLDWLVLIDDAPEPRGLERWLHWPRDRLVLLSARRADGPPRHPHDAHAAGTLAYLAWLAESDCDYCVKLDTDALAIADFRPSLERAIRARPDVGVFGAYRHNEAGGAPRDFHYFRRPLRKAVRPLRLRRSGLEQALTGPAARSRRYIRRALSAARGHGYELGEHCAGGAYAVTRSAAVTMHHRGYLADPSATAGAGLAEDVVLGLLVRACGLGLEDLVAPGEAFAVRYRGLVANPDELLRRGHGLVHSLKSHGGVSEEELRRAFRERRRRAGVAA